MGSLSLQGTESGTVRAGKIFRSGPFKILILLPFNNFDFSCTPADSLCCWRCKPMVSPMETPKFDGDLSRHVPFSFPGSISADLASARSVCFETLWLHLLCPHSPFICSSEEGRLLIPTLCLTCLRMKGPDVAARAYYQYYSLGKKSQSTQQSQRGKGPPFARAVGWCPGPPWPLWPPPGNSSVFTA